MVVKATAATTTTTTRINHPTMVLVPVVLRAMIRKAAVAPILMENEKANDSVTKVLAFVIHKESIIVHIVAFNAQNESRCGMDYLRSVL